MFTLEKGVSPNVVNVKIKSGNNEPHWFLLRSDSHFDNPHNNRELEKKHLDEALECGAGILDNGDLFCAMQGSWDPRKCKSSLRPEHQRADYLDALVETATDFYAPYAHNWVSFGKGNHECHDELTEILTNRGWVAFKDITFEDQVGTMRLSDGGFAWQSPTDYHRSWYVGEMVLGEGKTYNFCVTPGHDIVYKSKHGLSWKKTSADSFASMAHRAVQIPVSTVSCNSEFPLTDDEITFAGIVLTDGSVQEREGKTTQVLLFQAEDKAQYVRDLLNRLGYEYTETKHSAVVSTVVRGDEEKHVIQGQREMFRWYIKGESRIRALQIVPTKKKMPAWTDLMSDRQARVFFKAIVFGDGTTNAQSVTSHRIFGTRDSLERMQIVAVKHGFRTSLKEYREDEWLLNICDFTFTTVQQPLKSTEYAGYVYCCTVPNGTLITRRKGKVLISGNSSILKRHETDLTERLAQSLRERTKAKCFVTGYSGWIRFQFVIGGRKVTRTLWHMHGYGGGGPVTVDNIQAQRQNAYIEGADFMWSGHVHERWLREFQKVGLSSDGEVQQRSLWYIKSATYKEEYGTGAGGWHIETGKPPKPLGAWWLKLTPYEKTIKGDRNMYVDVEIIPAN